MNDEQFQEKVNDLRKQLEEAFCQEPFSQHWKIWASDGPQSEPYSYLDHHNPKVIVKIADFIMKNNLQPVGFSYNFEKRKQQVIDISMADLRARSWLFRVDSSRNYFVKITANNNANGFEPNDDLQEARPDAKMEVLLKQGLNAPSFRQVADPRVKMRQTPKSELLLLDAINEFLQQTGKQHKNIIWYNAALARKYLHLPPLAYAYNTHHGVFVTKTARKSLSFTLTSGKTVSAERVDLLTAEEKMTSIVQYYPTYFVDEENLAQAKGEEAGRRL